MRWLFRAEQPNFEPTRLIFFDETGVNLAMSRQYARAPRGQRAVGHVPKNWGDSTTIIAGIGLRGVVAPLVLDGSLTGEAFEAYIEQFVLPVVRPGDILVFDNLAAHKRARCQTLVSEASAQMLFLPPYSPDLNPIEMAWSKIKTYIRSNEPRTVSDLEKAVGDALTEVTSDDIENWMRHCGYAKAQLERKPL